MKATARTVMPYQQYSFSKGAGIKSTRIDVMDTRKTEMVWVAGVALLSPFLFGFGVFGLFVALHTGVCLFFFSCVHRCCHELFGRLYWQFLGFIALRASGKRRRLLCLVRFTATACVVITWPFFCRLEVSWSAKRLGSVGDNGQESRRCFRFFDTGPLHYRFRIPRWNSSSFEILFLHGWSGIMSNIIWATSRKKHAVDMPSPSRPGTSKLSGRGNLAPLALGVLYVTWRWLAVWRHM